MNLNLQSPSSRLMPKQASEVQANTLNDPATRRAIEQLLNIVKSCYGPRGKLKAIHNNSGGQVVQTSCSSSLFSGLSTHNPVIRLFVTSIQNFNSTFPDGGLFTASFGLFLTSSALDLDIPRRLVIEINDSLLSESLKFLQNDIGTGLKVNLELNKLGHLETLVKSVINTKRGCDLMDTDGQHIAKVLTNAFVTSFESSPSKTHRQRINYVTVEGLPPCETYYTNGILFATPDIPTYKEKELSLKMSPDGVINVALFNISLSGDAEGGIDDALYEMDEEVDMEDGILQQLEHTVDVLVKDGVGLVLCQKVIHPLVKRHLRQNNVMAIERLGSQYTKAIHALSGGVLISRLTAPVLPNLYGSLSGVQHVIINQKSFIHLKQCKSPICTVVLCNRCENALEELKRVSEAAEDVLHMAMYRPLGLPGAGCWQTKLASFLHTRLDHEKEEGESEMARLLAEGIPKTHVRSVTKTFCSALESLAKMLLGSGQLVHNLTGHQWSELGIGGTRSQTCACGMYEYNEGAGEGVSGFQTSTLVKNATPQVVDMYDVCINSLKTSVLTANMVLAIQSYVCDTN